jgi:hypothetical protein
MDIVQTKTFDRAKQKHTETIPIGRGADTTPYWVQWLVMKPQSHAVEPFQSQQATRGLNTTRNASESTVPSGTR